MEKSPVVAVVLPARNLHFIRGFPIAAFDYWRVNLEIGFLKILD
jgi:hypothetical protein